MAIESAFTKTFGNKTQAPAQGDAKKRPDANLWLNIGYTIEVDGENGREERFVSLPVGTGLDNQTEAKTNTGNALLNQQLAAGNALLAQLTELGMTKLAPGETMILPLQIQMRRVKDKVDVSTTPEGNPFVLDLAKMLGRAA